MKILADLLKLLQLLLVAGFIMIQTLNDLTYLSINVSLIEKLLDTSYFFN